MKEYSRILDKRKTDNDHIIMSKPEKLPIIKVPYNNFIHNPCSKNTFIKICVQFTFS